MTARRKLWMVLAVVLLLAGCGREERSEEKEPRESEERLQIGMSFDSFVIERWLRDRDLFVMTAKDLGADVNVQVANGDVEEQISQIRYFMKKDVDVIVIIAVDGEALSDVVKKAQEKGIRVVCYDRLIVNTETDLYLSFDNEMVGQLMGEAMVEALPEGGNIFAIYGSPADHNVETVQEGFFRAIGGSSLNIVYSEYCDNWLAELAFDAVERGLASAPGELVGVMCGNDDLASQAFRALAENRLAGKVVLVGQDADLSACQRIVEGTQTMTVYKPVELLAEKAAEFAAALGYERMRGDGRIQEEDIPRTARERLDELSELEQIDSAAGDAPGAESCSVPYYDIDPVAVTAENMDEVIIGSDFHTREDVYLNIH